MLEGNGINSCIGMEIGILTIMSSRKRMNIGTSSDKGIGTGGSATAGRCRLHACQRFEKWASPSQSPISLQEVENERDLTGIVGTSTTRTPEVRGPTAPMIMG